MMLCIENSKVSTQKTINKWIHWVAGYKINIQKSVVFYYTNNEVSESKNNISIKTMSENRILRNKLNQGDERPICWKL